MKCNISGRQVCKGIYIQVPWVDTLSELLALRGVPRLISWWARKLQQGQKYFHLPLQIVLSFQGLAISTQDIPIDVLSIRICNATLLCLSTFAHRLASLRFTVTDWQASRYMLCSHQANISPWVITLISILWICKICKFNPLWMQMWILSEVNRKISIVVISVKHDNLFFVALWNIITWLVKRWLLVES